MFFHETSTQLILAYNKKMFHRFFYLYEMWTYIHKIHLTIPFQSLITNTLSSSDLKGHLGSKSNVVEESNFFQQISTLRLFQCWAFSSLQSSSLVCICSTSFIFFFVLLCFVKRSKKEYIETKGSIQNDEQGYYYVNILLDMFDIMSS